MKRNLDILVISDLHLGTYGSEADEFLAYLDSINADKIVINGDFVDIMLFNKRFWPSSHSGNFQKINLLKSLQNRQKLMKQLFQQP